MVAYAVFSIVISLMTIAVAWYFLWEFVLKKIRVVRRLFDQDEEAEKLR